MNLKILSQSLEILSISFSFFMVSLQYNDSNVNGGNSVWQRILKGKQYGVLRHV